MEKRMKYATLGGGCFWCIEALYCDLKGVDRVVSGYAGGSVPNPTYQQVCQGNTGHAEVVQVQFDPKLISIQEIFRIFFMIHNPTTLNRQGGDVGTQYRSVIFYSDSEEQRIAKEILSEIESKNIWNNPIVTEIAPLETFYPAETYHQEYFKRNADQPYCIAVIEPKVSKFRKQYFDKLKK